MIFLPAIHLPLYSSLIVPVSTSPLARLLSVMKTVKKHSFISSVLVIAGGVMSLHYKTLTQAYAGCPILVCHGPVETTDSGFIILTGSQSSAMYVKGTNVFFSETAAISSLPFAIDDTPRSRSGSALDINDLIVDLYNGCKIANLRKNSLKPNSIPIIATNFFLDSDQR